MCPEYSKRSKWKLKAFFGNFFKVVSTSNVGLKLTSPRPRSHAAPTEPAGRPLRLLMPKSQSHIALLILHSLGPTKSQACPDALAGEAGGRRGIDSTSQERSGEEFAVIFVPPPGKQKHISISIP